MRNARASIECGRSALISTAQKSLPGNSPSVCSDSNWQFILLMLQHDIVSPSGFSLSLLVLFNSVLECSGLTHCSTSLSTSHSSIHLALLLLINSLTPGSSLYTGPDNNRITPLTTHTLLSLFYLFWHCLPHSCILCYLCLLSLSLSTWCSMYIFLSSSYPHSFICISWRYSCDAVTIWHCIQLYHSHTCSASILIYSSLTAHILFALCSLFFYSPPSILCLYCPVSFYSPLVLLL